MKRFFLLLFAISLLPASIAAQENMPPLKEVEVPENAQITALEKIQDYLRSVGSLKADFTQIAPTGNIATGKMYLERPGKIRFDFGESAKFLIVADGRTLSLIDYEIGQVTSWPVNDTPLKLLLGDRITFDGLKARIIADVEGEPGVTALMAEDPSKPEMGVITVYFKEDKSAGRMVIKRWIVVDAQGQMTQVTLRNSEENIKLDSKLWTFKDPRGNAKRRRFN